MMRTPLRWVRSKRALLFSPAFDLAIAAADEAAQAATSSAKKEILQTKRTSHEH